MSNSTNKEIKELDVKSLIDKNFMFVFMLGSAMSIISQLQTIIENYNGLTPESLINQIDWFNEAIENIVYKNIPAPKMP